MSIVRTVTYTSPRTGQPVTVTGVVVEGTRYRHLYLTLDTDKGVLRIPLGVITDG